MVTFYEIQLSYTINFPPFFYFQICVARLFPESLDSTCTDLHNSSSNSIHSTSFNPHSNSLTGGNDVWFCPCHTCIGCHALQSTATTLATVDLPVRLWSQQLAAVESGLNLAGSVNRVHSAVFGSDTDAATSVTTPESLANTTTDPNTTVKPNGSHNRHQLRQKPLRNCTNCPFAVCGDCEKVLGEGCGVLHPKKGSEVECYFLFVFLPLLCCLKMNRPLLVFSSFTCRTLLLSISLTFFHCFITGVGVP